MAIMILMICGLFAHILSYYLEKTRIIKSKKWDLNICCGKTDGGGVNADIIQHKDLPNFKLISDIYNLSFPDKEFTTILCSHTMEHVDDPKRFFEELNRVGREVTVVIPPLYDFFAVLNVFEHKFIFLTFKKMHNKLPKYVRLPFAESLQKKVGQIIHA